ncbi:hypothetical protein NDU88_005095 [Pleurodeles waltl]|uniref:Uncharacterized protein n=1 Tax=Pleurodeles waltl TaxID=8319 RepID=A0AAV7UK06_PLEWA|nr:hypothetical protein NDU88_005095 [Pleurodeles waltl]
MESCHTRSCFFVKKDGGFCRDLCCDEPVERMKDDTLGRYRHLAVSLLKKPRGPVRTEMRIVKDKLCHARPKSMAGYIMLHHDAKIGVSIKKACYIAIALNTERSIINPGDLL